MPRYRRGNDVATARARHVPPDGNREVAVLFCHVASERPAAPTQPPVDDIAELAARIRAMLSRWVTEPVTDEPEWSVEDIEPMQLEGDANAPRE